jgi:hypothetical protein
VSGGAINGQKLDGIQDVDENAATVLDGASSEMNPDNIVSAANQAGDTELESPDSSEFDFFVGKWLMLQTDYIDQNLDISDEENNSYIDIYKENGKYHAKIKRYTGYMWVYDTGILSKKPAWELPYYSDSEIYINCDGMIYRLRTQKNLDNPNPLYHHAIYLGDGIQSFAYQFRGIIYTLGLKTGILNDDRVRVRAEPNLSGEILGIVNRGDKVEILKIGREKQKIDGLESVWYKIRTIRTVANIEGWVFGAYVNVR